MDHHKALAQATELRHLILDGGEFDGTAPTPCPAFDLDALIEHCIWAEGFLTTAAGGLTTPSGGLLERLEAAGDLAVTTWAERGTGGTVRLGANEMPAEVAIQIHIVETYVHAWDLAMAIGVRFEPAPELTAAALEGAAVFMDDSVRGAEGEAPFGPAVPGAHTDIDRMIALSGRQPNWRPVT